MAEKSAFRQKLGEHRSRPERPFPVAHQKKSARPAGSRGQPHGDTAELLREFTLLFAVDCKGKRLIPVYADTVQRIEMLHHELLVHQGQFLKVFEAMNGKPLKIRGVLFQIGELPEHPLLLVAPQRLSRAETL